MTIADSIFLRKFQRVAEQEGLLPAGKSDPALVDELFRRKWREEAGLAGIIAPVRSDPALSDRIFRQKWLEAANVFNVLFPFANVNSWRGNVTRANRNYVEGITDTAIWGVAPIGSFTHSLWYKIQGTQFSNSELFGTGLSSAGWQVRRVISAGSVQFSVGSISTPLSVIPTVDMWANGVWQHLVVSHDAPNRQMTLYSNGEKFQSAINTSPVTRPLGAAMTYGASFPTSVNNWQHVFIDTAAFWKDHVVTDLEAAGLYDAGFLKSDPRSVIPDPLWYLTFGDDVADDATPGTGAVVDQTPNGNDFTPIQHGAGADSVFVADVPPAAL